MDMPSGGKGGSEPKIVEIQGRIYAIGFAEDDKKIISGGAEGLVRRWRVNDERLEEVGQAIQAANNVEVFSVAISPDQKRLVCGLKFLPGCDKGQARVIMWDMQTWEKVLEVRTHTNIVTAIDISPDSKKIATGGFDRRVFICCMTSGEQLLGPLEHGAVVAGLRFSPNGDRIATATCKDPGNESIRVYDSSDGRQLHEFPLVTQTYPVSPFAWSADGRHLFAVSTGEAKCFDTSSGDLLDKWSIHSKGSPTSILLARNQKFIVVTTFGSLSFWDVSTHEQIGTTIKHASTIWSVALSANDDCLVTGEANGKITLRSLRDVLRSYLTVNYWSGPERRTLLHSSDFLFARLAAQLPLMSLSEATLKSWTGGDLTRAEELLTGEIVLPSTPFHHARALAQRSLVRTRMKQWEMAVDDAEESVRTWPSIMGHVANAMSRTKDGDHESAMRVFDLVFGDGLLAAESRYLLLIKAIILFECGKRDVAVSRIDDLIKIMDDRPLCRTVQAQMLLLVGSVSLSEGDTGRAMALFKRAQDAIPFQQSPHLIVISLIFGWDFDRLALAIHLQLCKAMHTAGHGKVAESLSTIIETLGDGILTSETTADFDPDLIQQCLVTLEKNGDAAVQSVNFKEAIVRYSTALHLNPSNRADLLVKRSKARAVLGLWNDALQDADEAIAADPGGPWGYERKHAALHGLQRYDEAVGAFSRMLALIETSLDPEISQLGKTYISLAQSEAAIGGVTRELFKMCPLVLVDVKSGCLCDGPERIRTFQSEAQFKELVSSMTERLDDERIQQVVEKYFEYVTFSHVWAGKEPSFQDVTLVNSVWNLDSSTVNEKLKKFCEVVREEGYRWAWCDTCCIDKTISTVLNQSLVMMYKWYEASAATFVHLASVVSPSVLGDLIKSLWMTRAWTVQELLAPKVIRFYDQNWKLYLGDTCANHKESPEIVQELANAIGISSQTITTFRPDDLHVREKLRLASTRNATVEEDVAYSLIGIFKSDIRPQYGEGDSALGHLLEEIVARSGEVRVLSWFGKSSSYNSCLPATLAVYSQTPYVPPAIEDAEMDAQVTELKMTLAQEDALLIYDRIGRLPAARFANRRLHLPCVMFSVKRLGVQEFVSGQEHRYRARVSGIGHVEFQTSDKLPLSEPRKLVLVHPWVRDLRDPFDGFVWGDALEGDKSDSDSDSDSDSNSDSSPSSPFPAVPAAVADDHVRALRLVARLRQPFSALLLQKQTNGEFKRVAAQHEIIIPGLEPKINFVKDVRTEVVEIL